MQIRHLGLAAAPGSVREHQAAMLEFQYLLSWRESSVRTILVEDVNIRPGGHHVENAENTSFLTLTARPRTLKGRLVRGVGACSLTCHHHPSHISQRNPLALQLRFYQFRFSSAGPHDLYWARLGLCLQPQVVFDTLAACLHAIQAVLPPMSSCISHSLRSGSVTAQQLLNVPLARTVLRGASRNSKTVVNVYFDSRLHLSAEMTHYFLSLTGASNPSRPSPQ